MISKNAKMVLGAALAAAVLGTGAQAGDAVAGKKVYNKCKACHTLEEGGQNRVGPNLFGVVGREAGAVEGFKYSAAMKDSGIVWTEEKLAEFLAKPKTVVPKTKMAFPGLKKPEDIANVIALMKGE